MPDQHSEQMRELAFSTARAALQHDRSVERMTTLVRKLDLVADGEILKVQAEGGPVACKPGCDHCCKRVVFASIPEIIIGAEFVARTFTPERRAVLRKRLAAYELAVSPRFGLDFAQARPVCPLLENGQCTAYEARPLACRGMNSFDAGACERWIATPALEKDVPRLQEQLDVTNGLSAGFSGALGEIGFDGGEYDFGRALKIFLDAMDMRVNPFAGPDPFRAARVRGTSAIPSIPVNVPVEYRSYAEGEEPIGSMKDSDLAVANHFEMMVGDMDSALESLKGEHPIYRLRRISVPRVYSSEAEIGDWRARFLAELKAFSESEFDERQAFDALSLVSTFNLHYQPDDITEPLREFGELICNRITAKALPEFCTPMEPNWRTGKLRVGYISDSIRTSNGANWAEGWLKNHGEDIETFVFNLHDSEDRWSERFRRESDHYVQLCGEVGRDARYILKQKLDVLIYPDIGGPPRNHQFASMRLAPVQCAAWGHPVTTGMPTVDYYLSSELMEPENGDDHYTEKLIRLPNSGVCYPRPKANPDVSSITKAHFGLDDGPLYLCGQNLMKCTPRWDLLYREINERTGRPVVFTEGQAPGDTRITKARLEKAGVRAHWIPRLDRQDFFRLVSLADAFLDPPGWNGGITTIAALNLGVPVVSLPTEFMRGRLSRAFLMVAGCDGLLAKDLADYVDLVANTDRRRAAMAGFNPAALFEDKTPVTSLDDFIRRAASS